MTVLPSALTPIKRTKTTAEEVEERLILAIALGEKQPGERITEAEVAKSLNVSRVPAREAMRKLQNYGILTAAPQRGLVVLDYSSERIQEILDLRVALESIFLKKVMARPDLQPVLMDDLEKIVVRMREMADAQDPVLLSLIDLEFHRTVATASGNKLGLHIWEGLAQHMLIMICRDWALASNRIAEVKLHLEMLDFIRDGDSKNIEKFLGSHFFLPTHDLSPGDSE